MSSNTATTEQTTIRDERKKRLKRIAYQFSQNRLSVAGLGMVSIVVLVAILAPVIAPHPDHTHTTQFAVGTTAPSMEYPLGTDSEGRDILSRILFGARLSLFVGVVVLAISIPLGVTLGAIAGYFGGIVNTVIMRVVDIFLAVPPLVLALAVVAATQQSLLYAIIAISFSWWSWYARLVQGEVLSIKENEFVEAGRAIGSSWHRMIFREILPNISGPILVKGTLDMGIAILVAATLSFLGVGAQPPTPEWGLMIAQGRSNLGSQWWISTFPGLAIAFTVMGFNFLGDGLRDILDVEIENL